MCIHCDDIEALNASLDMTVSLTELMCEKIETLEFRGDVVKRYLRISSEHTSQLEDRVYRLETVLTMMCHSLGIKLVEPLNVSSTCNHSMGARSSVLDTHLASWRSLVEAPRIGSQPGGEEQEGSQDNQGPRIGP